MHKNFYASGFAYHSDSQKILLQYSDIKPFTHTLFSKKCSENEDFLHIFQQQLSKSLNIDIPQDCIKHIYEYSPEDSNELYSIFYADISSLGDEYFFEHTDKTEWFTTRQLSKLKVTEQTRHHIMIGQRVIRASAPIL